MKKLILPALMLSCAAGARFTADGAGGGAQPMSLDDALKTLDATNDDHWTAAGQPRMDYLEGLTGGNLTRDEVDKKFTKKRADLQASNEPTGDGAGTADGERIEQNKQSLGEALATGQQGIADIGEGSITETAPAVTSSISEPDRVVQQGDDVILHVRSPIMGRTEVLAAVIKVNQDGTIACRVPNNGYGRSEDFSPVFNKPQNGEFWWTWPERAQNLDDVREAEKAVDPAPVDT